MALSQYPESRKPLFYHGGESLSPRRLWLRRLGLGIGLAVLSLAHVLVGVLCWATGLDRLWSSLVKDQGLTISLIVWHQRAPALWLLWALLGAILWLWVREFWSSRSQHKTNPGPLLLILTALSLLGGLVLARQDSLVMLARYMTPRGELHFLGQTLRLGEDERQFDSPVNPGSVVIRGDRLTIPKGLGPARVPETGEVVGKVLSAYSGYLWIVDAERQVWRVRVQSLPALKENQVVRVRGSSCDGEFCGVVTPE